MSDTAMMIVDVCNSLTFDSSIYKRCITSQITGWEKAKSEAARFFPVRVNLHGYAILFGS